MISISIRILPNWNEKKKKTDRVHEIQFEIFANIRHNDGLENEKNEMKSNG